MNATAKFIVRLGRQWALLRMASFAGRGGLPAFARPLIVAPHPDDETFGVGGVIASIAMEKLKLRNAEMLKPETLRPETLRPESGHQGSSIKDQASDVHIVLLTSGGSAHEHCCGISRAELCARREAAARKATALLGVPESNLHFLRLTDGQLPHPGQAGFAEVSDRLSEVIWHVRPDAVFAPHPFESWSDHVAAEELTREAIKKAESRNLKAESGKSGVDSRNLKAETGAAGKPETLEAQSRNKQSSVGDLRSDFNSPFSQFQLLSTPSLYHYCVWFWFSMPLRRALRVDWRKAVTVKLGERAESRKLKAERGERDSSISAFSFQLSAFEAKRAAMQMYLEDLAPCGKPTCGVLPEELLRAFEWDKELCFRAKPEEESAKLKVES